MSLGLTKEHYPLHLALPSDQEHIPNLEKCDFMSMF